MSKADKEVLQKAIEIAIENGYKPDDNFINFNGLPIYLFSHDFAKAFWGDNYSDGIMRYVEYDNGHIEQDAVLNWVHHLQQMVVEENRIDYLRKFIKEDKDE